MRLPYVSEDPKFDDPEDQAIVARVQERRGYGGLLDLDRALLHAPPIADGWNGFLGSIRTQTSLSQSVSETAICRVAVLNKAHYELSHHAPLLLYASNTTITPTHITALESTPPHHHPTPPFDAAHSAVLAYTDAMTLSVQVPEAVFALLKQHFNEREVVEITATIAAYNCVSRFLVALDVGEMNGKKWDGRPEVEES
ncbi:hypothetical protein P280DRAFT_415067 [Massarina eburnea CBS 473.64]|uniref:Carboxymuconolactone decarboxylase-like domain-containing protein n=1 Tax=Massarina eburnea CBS 473.64 TaxID=1395130 RepID=A0A6A6SGP0_9PLEO|nr:hypothetical protein P280DRAFT_415067 [Massarina eburnea CBS 473.64]